RIPVFVRPRNPLWNAQVSAKRSKSGLTACTKRKDPNLPLESLSRNCLVGGPLTPLALLFRRLLLCGLFLWFGFGLGFCFLLGSLLRRLLCCRFGSRRPRSGSRRRLRLFFADDQLFLFGLHDFASEFVVFFQPGQLVVVFEI